MLGLLLRFVVTRTRAARFSVSCFGRFRSCRAAPLKRCARRFLASPRSRARSSLFSAQALRASVFGLTLESRPEQPVFLLVGRASVKSSSFFLPKDSAPSDSILPVCIRYSSRGKILVPGFSARSSCQLVLQFLLEGPPILNFDSHVLVKFCVGGLLVLFLSYRIKKLEFS
jgi:hypothetical protein